MSPKGDSPLLMFFMAFLPGILSVSSLTPTSAVLTATASTGGTGGVTQLFQHSVHSANNWQTFGAGNSLTVTDYSLIAGIEYDWRVQYMDSTGATVYATASGTTSAYPNPVPAGTFLAVYSGKTEFTVGDTNEVAWTVYRADGNNLSPPANSTFVIYNYDSTVFQASTPLPPQGSGPAEQQIVSYMQEWTTVGMYILTATIPTDDGGEIVVGAHVQVYVSPQTYKYDVDFPQD